MNGKIEKNMREYIMRWKDKYDCVLESPVNEKSIEELNKTIGPLPSDFLEFYLIANNLNLCSIPLL